MRRPIDLFRAGIVAGLALIASAALAQEKGSPFYPLDSVTTPAPPPAPAVTAPAAPTPPAATPEAAAAPAAPAPSATELRALATSSATADAANAAKAAALPDGALEVTATGTLEWLRQDQMYVARQNAVARHNDTTLKGDVLIAHYQVPQGKKSGSEITLVTAEGNPVEVIAPTAVAYGQHGTYDLARHLIELLGDNLKLVTTDEVITARDSLQYFEDLDTGIANGSAVMLRGPDKLTADVISAKFVHAPGSNDKNDKGQTAKAAPAPQLLDTNGNPVKPHSLEHLDAKGHVVLVTQTDVVTGDSGTYNPITDKATVLGTVKITRDQNQIDGNRAEVDMSTGISRMFADQGQKVHALFVPKKKDKSKTDPAASQASVAEDKQQ